MVGTMHRFCVDEKGATAIEYGLIAALLVIGIMVTLNEFARESSELYNYIEGSVSNVVSGSS
jgi:pilus assembly protein Flp/PilA